MEMFSPRVEKLAFKCQVSSSTMSLVENRHEGSISLTPTKTLDVQIRRVSFWKGLGKLEVDVIVVCVETYGWNR